MDRRAFLSAAACSALTASGQAARAQTNRRFAAAEAFSAEHNGASFLVARHGVVLAEAYPRGNPDARWPIGEATRAFAVLLAATLAEDRLLSLDEPVALTIGDWGAHPTKSMISLRVLLSGASGIAFGRNDEPTLANAIALEPRHEPGTRFLDDAAPFVLFAEIARRKLVADGREPDPAYYLTGATLQRIGCIPIGWARGGDGAARFDDGIALSARSWALAGELLRREGVWRAQEVASSSVIREALRGSFAEPRAGFGLWLATPGRAGDLDIDSDLWRAASPAPPGLAMAAGAGGQRLYVSPSDGLVIVRQARDTERDTHWSDAQFLSLVYRDL